LFYDFFRKFRNVSADSLTLSLFQLLDQTQFQMRIFIYISLLFFTSVFTSVLIAQDHSIMSYNIRYGTANDGPDHWDHRKESLTNEIAFYEPDFVGVQEALDFQMEYLKENLPQYTYIGVGRDDGKTKGEYSGIFYHTERVKLLDEGTFWLSETPDEVSKGWDAALPRICTYGHFKYKKRPRKNIWVFNTHFDHRGHEAREKSVELIVEKAKKLSNEKEAILISGDFNLGPESTPIQNMKKHFHDSYETSELPPFGHSLSFNGFKMNPERGQRIDYIFTNEKVKVKKIGILSTLIDGHYNSDHFPVLMYFDMAK